MTTWLMLAALASCSNPPTVCPAQPLPDVPPWALLVGGAVGGLLLAFGASFARRTARRIRDDGDPTNDWIADLLDSAADAQQRGDHEQAAVLVDSARRAAAKKRKRAPIPVTPGVGATGFVQTHLFISGDHFNPAARCKRCGMTREHSYHSDTTTKGPQP